MVTGTIPAALVGCMYLRGDRVGVGVVDQRGCPERERLEALGERFSDRGVRCMVGVDSVTAAQVCRRAR